MGTPREGVTRILDLMVNEIEMTSFMIGDAVRRHPDVAAEIVKRGHEAGAHGRRRPREYHLPRHQEKAWIADNVDAIEQATGTRLTIWIVRDSPAARSPSPRSECRREAPSEPAHVGSAA